MPTFHSHRSDFWGHFQYVWLSSSMIAKISHHFSMGIWSPLWMTCDTSTLWACSWSPLQDVLCPCGIFQFILKVAGCFSDACQPIPFTVVSFHIRTWGSSCISKILYKTLCWGLISLPLSLPCLAGLALPALSACLFSVSLFSVEHSIYIAWDTVSFPHHGLSLLHPLDLTGLRVSFLNCWQPV